MKHTIKTPQGSITLEVVGTKAGNQALQITAQKPPFPAFPFFIRPEDAQAVHVALGMALQEMEPEQGYFPKVDCMCKEKPCAHQLMLQRMPKTAEQAQCMRTGGWCQCTGVCKAQKAVAA